MSNSNRGGPDPIVDGKTIDFGGVGEPGGGHSGGPKEDGSEASEQDMGALTMTALYCIPIVLAIGCTAGGLLYPRAAKAFLRRAPCLSTCACLQESEMSPEEKKASRGDTNESKGSRQSSHSSS